MWDSKSCYRSHKVRCWSAPPENLIRISSWNRLWGGGDCLEGRHSGGKIYSVEHWENTEDGSDVPPMLGQRLRRWPSIGETLVCCGCWNSWRWHLMSLGGKPGPRPDTSNHYLASVAIENNQLGCWKSRKLALCGRPGVGGRGWPGVGGGGGPGVSAPGWHPPTDIKGVANLSSSGPHGGRDPGCNTDVSDPQSELSRRRQIPRTPPPSWPTGISNRPISDCDTGDL